MLSILRYRCRHSLGKRTTYYFRSISVCICFGLEEMASLMFWAGYLPGWIHGHAHIHTQSNVRHLEEHVTSTSTTVDKRTGWSLMVTYRDADIQLKLKKNLINKFLKSVCLVFLCWRDFFEDLLKVRNTLLRKKDKCLHHNIWHNLRRLMY